MKRTRLMFGMLLAATDGEMSLLAFYLAYRLRALTMGEAKIGPFGDYVALAGLQLFSTLIVFFFYKFYHRRRGNATIDEFYQIFGAVSVATLLSIAFLSLVLKDSLEYQRSMILYAWAFALLTITAGRFFYNRWLRLMQKRGQGLDQVLIVGTGEIGRTILQTIQHQPGLGYQVVGFVDSDHEAEHVMDIPVLGTINDLPDVIEYHNVSEVIIGLPEATHQELVGIISQCEREKVSIRVFPDVFQIMASEVTIGDLGGLPLLTVRDVALRGWKLTLKRTVDVMVSSILLLILSPLMLLMAVLVKLDSPGPALFIQERMGLDAKPFPMIKFRSMRRDAEAHGPGWTVQNDPRRTRIGTFIRRTSIDELPQLINVLMGDMSLVGPRPEQPTYVEQFRQSIPRYMDRHREKAGMTGWAQVNGLRGDSSILERTKYDLWYIENWSLWLDFKILVLQAFRVFGDRSAY
jgi:exopolysaccharide biosynthesis polyprenyl glycosylphosphotransferase